MNERRRLKLKRFNIHPVTTFIILSGIVILVSYIFSIFNAEIAYNKLNSLTLGLESITVTTENLLSFDGIKYIISNAAKNFASFAPLNSLLLALIGLSVAHATGLIDTFIKRKTIEISNKKITFMLIFLAIFSSIINEVGYVILIPLAALVYLANGRNPLLGITTAFCGVAFGYGATLFAGSMEVALTPYTTTAARIISGNAHIPMLSNLFILIGSTIIIAIVGTLVIENIIVKKIGRYRSEEDADSSTKEVDVAAIIEDDQKKLETEIREKKGLKNAYIVVAVFLLVFVYMIIPGLPLSGLLLDMNSKTYIDKLFGETSYFQDGFTFMVTLLFLVAGIAYGLGAKTLKNDKELVEKATDYLKDIGEILILLFFAAQFIAIFRKSNIGTFIVAFGANVIKDLSFTGLPLIILVLLIVAISNLFVTSPVTKWSILSPVVVPLMMQSNIDPGFAQFILRAGDSITKGITPLLAYFVVYVGYLNIYNKSKEVITIKKAISYVYPYCLIIGFTWIAIVVFWYLIGLPIGPGVFPTM